MTPAEVCGRQRSGPYKAHAMTSGSWEQVPRRGQGGPAAVTRLGARTQGACPGLSGQARPARRLKDCAWRGEMTGEAVREGLTKPEKVSTHHCCLGRWRNGQAPGTRMASRSHKVPQMTAGKEPGTSVWPQQGTEFG